MNIFPETLHLNNKENFKDINYNRVLCLLREEIYIHIIKYETIKDENNYFDTDTFCKKYNVQHFTKSYDDEKISLMTKMMETVIKELRDLGWKCQLSFNDTGLFIYSTEKLPPSCW
jgi:hypothetical protein